MRKLFISQLMNGRTSDEIKAERDNLYKVFNDEIENVELIDSLIISDETNPIILLGESIKLMGNADIVLMASNWEKGRGCWIEYETALKYNKEIWFNYYGNKIGKKGE